MICQKAVVAIVDDEGQALGFGEHREGKTPSHATTASARSSKASPSQNMMTVPLADERERGFRNAQCGRIRRCVTMPMPGSHSSRCS